ncbi:hypothetical protein ABK040_002027 [Willaertia magna]
MEHFLSVDIPPVIGKYLDDVKDFLYLLQINKFVYHNVLANNENNKIIFDSELFQKKKIVLTKNFPKYLFKIKRLNLKKNGNDFSLLNEFRLLKSLKIKNLPEDFIFTNMLNLEELYIKNGILQLNTLSNLKQLKVLNLDKGCCFTDDCLKELKNLTTLQLFGKVMIAGECLQNFPNLTFLHSECFGNSNALEYIVNLQNLTELCVFTIFTSTTFLRKCINLKILDINYIREIDENDFYNLKNLQKLTISGDGLLDNCFDYLINLEELDCELENIANINRIKNLKRIKIRTVPKSFVEKDLENFTNIVKFNAPYVYNITGKYLGNNLNLTKLFVMGTQINDKYILNLNKLKRLSLIKCKNITGECLQKNFMKNLTELRLSETNVPEKYLTNFKQLKILYFSCCNITGDYLKNLTTLTKLYVSQTNIRDECLIKLKQLTHLDVSHCKFITGECLLHLNNLQHLYINDTNIKEEYLIHLVTLKELCIKNCPNIINGQFLLKNKKITFIDIFNESAISEIKKRIENGKTIKEILRPVTKQILLQEEKKAIKVIKELSEEKVVKEQGNNEIVTKGNKEVSFVNYLKQQMNLIVFCVVILIFIIFKVVA